MDAFERKAVPENLYEELRKAIPEKEDATRNLSGALEQVDSAGEHLAAVASGSVGENEASIDVEEQPARRRRGEFAGLHAVVVGAASAASTCAAGSTARSSNSSSARLTP